MFETQLTASEEFGHN